MQLPAVITPFLDSALEFLSPVITYLSMHPRMNYILLTLIFLLLVLLLALSRKKTPLRTSSLSQLAETELRAIAGDDVISSQLDLAKAYIEMNQKKIARDMLDSVIKKGSSHQQDAARLLIQSL
jgi:FimV-like protein